MMTTGCFVPTSAAFTFFTELVAPSNVTSSVSGVQVQSAPGHLFLGSASLQTTRSFSCAATGAAIQKMNARPKGNDGLIRLTPLVPCLAGALKPVPASAE